MQYTSWFLACYTPQKRKDNYTLFKYNKANIDGISDTLRLSDKQVNLLVSGKLVESNESFQVFGKLFKVFFPNEIDVLVMNFTALCESYTAAIGMLQMIKILKNVRKLNLLEMLNELRTTLGGKKRLL